MPTLSFKNRIALNFLIGTSFIVLLVFVVIYRITVANAIADINSDLELEVQKHQHDVSMLKDTSRLVLPNEWRETEHNDELVNPVFVEIYDRNGKFREKSPNLHGRLKLYEAENVEFRDTILKGQRLRQTQSPLYFKGSKIGYVVIAMSVEAPYHLISDLRLTLLVAFPLVLLCLYSLTRFMAGRSIRPVQEITATASIITDNNLEKRIKLPEYKDELYVLSNTINNLLGRIQSAIEREKQFTSSASHELRTPLAVIKGTLEVLMRKPRDVAEYREKIEFCMREVDRLNNLVDQLLLLARFEDQKVSVKKLELNLDEIILESLQRFSPKITGKNLTIDFKFDKHFPITSDAYLVSIILDNLLSNAMKYSPDNGTVRICLSSDGQTTNCIISDDGFGISKQEQQLIYEQFYRSNTQQNPDIKGFGLGLSIVKRLCVLLDIDVLLESDLGQGTTVQLIF
ncbi:MAG: HAMP domain-containing histidine kinase [Flavobacterium sp.]|uniref:sensor histidine kinase n=1 Tax=Flavobacterium sp. TaxID=239 RepID=UPI00121C721F|nr:HAMP domain-containing sensor histidine kinase [Flavobacterium sp.]RZJ67370.1 MAG: HAMP domain-containing histidine kinase [Flavobacterium sp.]